MFTRAACVSLVLISFVAPCPSFVQDPAAGKTQTPPKPRTESLWHKLLRISGIGDSPTTLRGPGDEVETGQIWTAEIEAASVHRLTARGGYRSPVFIPIGKDVLALKGTSVVRVSSADAEAKVLYQITGVSKLVGFSTEDPDKVLILRQDAARHTEVALLSLSDGKVSPLAYNPDSNDDQHIIEYLQGWSRMYNDKSLFVRSQTKSSMGGKIQWTDVFLRAGTSTPIDVSKCDGVNCGQPSLSADGQLVVFIRAEQD